MKRIALFLVLPLLAAAPSLTAQATLASFHGTYTFQSVVTNHYSEEFNMSGQQVGFCNGQQVVGYYCNEGNTLDLFQGSFVSDGAGHVSSGTWALTADPNSYECNTNNKRTTPCPVTVPSGHTYSPSTSYAIGASVDLTVGTVTRTFQAVRASVGKPPNWGISADAGYICTNSNINTCLWTQIPASQTSGKGSQSGTIFGTYTILANGSGVMTLTASNCVNCGPVEIAFTVSPTSQVGQGISIAGISKLGNQFRMVGSGVRIK